MNAPGKWLLAALTGLTLASASPAQEPLYPDHPYPDHQYYVTYGCPEWRQTAPMDSDGAADLAARLESLGAETRLIGKGAAIDDPEYPTTAFRLAAVKFRLSTPKQRVTPDPWEARRWLARFQRLGLDAYLTVDKPYEVLPPVPDDAPPAAKLKAHTVWTGTISQEGRALPARLVLDRRGDDVSGELSFRLDDQSYRARVRGAVRDDAISFTTYESLEGRVYLPCEYHAALTGATMKGTWEYAPDQLEDEFDFALTDR